MTTSGATGGGGEYREPPESDVCSLLRITGSAGTHRSTGAQPVWTRNQDRKKTAEPPKTA